MNAIGHLAILRQVRAAAEEARRLAAIVRQSGRLPRNLEHQPFPRLPGSLTLDDLHFDCRTRNALHRGHITSVEGLNSASLRRVSYLRGLGFLSFCRLLDAVGNLPERVKQELQLQRKHEKQVAARRELLEELRGHPGVQEINSDDPRLGPFLRRVSSALRSIGQLLDEDVTSLDSINWEAFHELYATICRFQHGTVEEEYLDIVLKPARRGPNEPVVRAHLGLGQSAVALSAVARDRGVSRQHAQQICTPLRLRTRAVYAPRIASILDELAGHTWELGSSVQQELVNEGRLEPGTSLTSVLQLARFLQRTTEIALVSTDGGEVVLPAERKDDVFRLIARIHGAVTRLEVAPIEDLWEPASTPWGQRELRALQRTVLPSLCRLTWLDQTRDWFCIADSPPGPLLGGVAKVLSVCPRVKGQSLWQAVRRDLQIGLRMPPRPVLFEFFCSRPEFNVEGEWISLREPPGM